MGVGTGGVGSTGPAGVVELTWGQVQLADRSNSSNLTIGTKQLATAGMDDLFVTTLNAAGAPCGVGEPGDVGQPIAIVAGGDERAPGRDAEEEQPRHHHTADEGAHPDQQEQGADPEASRHHRPQRLRQRRKRSQPT